MHAYVLCASFFFLFAGYNTTQVLAPKLYLKACTVMWK
jgi:hypothetical protein